MIQIYKHLVSLEQIYIAKIINQWQSKIPLLKDKNRPKKSLLPKRKSNSKKSQLKKAKKQNLQNPNWMKMKRIPTNSNSPKTKMTKNFQKTTTQDKAKMKALTLIKTTATSNLHHNHWRPKTWQSSKWVSENEEVPKWITSWTGKRTKRKILSGKIRDKTISEISKIKNKTKIINKAAPEETNSTVISVKPNPNTLINRKKPNNLRSTKTNSKKRKSNKNLWEKYKLPRLKRQPQKLIPRPKNNRAKRSQSLKWVIVTYIKSVPKNNFWERPPKPNT